MGELPKRGFPTLTRIARLDRRAPALGLFAMGLAATMTLRPRLVKHGGHVLRESLGQTLPAGADAAAPLWFLAHAYALHHRAAVRRAGHRGFGLGLGESLFRSILSSRSGTQISEHHYEDTWSLLRHRDRKVHLAIPELLAALDALRTEPEPAPDFPFVLIAGERRSYNANTIFRDPAWRKQDPDGALSIHPADADELGLADGDAAAVRSERGEIVVTIKRTDTVRRGVVTLPNGYGLRYAGAESKGPALNRLTSAQHRDSLAATPFHKHVAIRIEPLVDGDGS
jgi:anaerobic selenocysteine-containing dehydrogenase